MTSETTDLMLELILHKTRDIVRLQVCRPIHPAHFVRFSSRCEYPLVYLQVLIARTVHLFQCTDLQIQLTFFTEAKVSPFESVGQSLTLSLHVENSVRMRRVVSCHASALFLWMQVDSEVYHLHLFRNVSPAWRSTMFIIIIFVQFLGMSWIGRVLRTSENRVSVRLA